MMLILICVACNFMIYASLFKFDNLQLSPATAFYFSAATILLIMFLLWTIAFARMSEFRWYGFVFGLAAAMSASIGLFALGYATFGGLIDTSPSLPATSIANLVTGSSTGLATSDPWDCLYFSVMTWTTVGYGDFKPAPSTRGLAACEAIAGYLVMTLIIALFVKYFETVPASISGQRDEAVKQEQGS